MSHTSMNISYEHHMYTIVYIYMHASRHISNTLSAYLPVVLYLDGSILHTYNK